MMHIADDQNALMDYLYEEGDASERLKTAQHLQQCARCSVAVLELQTVRGVLSEWAPPASPLGFRIVQDGRGMGAPGSEPQPPALPQPAWGVPSSRLGAWAQAAAAVLLFGAGMAVSQLAVDYRDGAVTVRARSTVPPVPQTSGARNASIQLPASPATLQELERSLRSELRQAESTPSVSRSDLASTEQLLERVRAMIEQSEIRQQRELALRLSQVASEVDTQHQADLLRIQQNLGQIEMETGAQINQQQQLMDYLVRTSGGQK